MLSIFIVWITITIYFDFSHFWIYPLFMLMVEGVNFGFWYLGCYAATQLATQ